MAGKARISVNWYARACSQWVNPDGWFYCIGPQYIRKSIRIWFLAVRWHTCNRTHKPPDNNSGSSWRGGYRYDWSYW